MIITLQRFHGKGSTPTRGCAVLHGAHTAFKRCARLTREGDTRFGTTPGPMVDCRTARKRPSRSHPPPPPPPTRFIIGLDRTGERACLRGRFVWADVLCGPGRTDHGYSPLLLLTCRAAFPALWPDLRHCHEHVRQPPGFYSCWHVGMSSAPRTAPTGGTSTLSCCTCGLLVSWPGLGRTGLA